MKKVYKYDIPIDDYFTLELPMGSTILKVDTQFGNPKMWVLVDPDETKFVGYRFRLAGTGHEIKENGIHIDSFKMSGDRLIFHLFLLH